MARELQFRQEVLLGKRVEFSAGFIFLNAKGYRAHPPGGWEAPNPSPWTGSGGGETFQYSRQARLPARVSSSPDRFGSG